MAESIVQVTEGTGKKLHTFQRTVGANSVEDEAVYPAEFPSASYSLIASNISTATSASHILQIMAGATNYVRIRRIYVQQTGLAGAVNTFVLQFFRLTTAGTGGTAVTARPYDSSDAAAGATGMTRPTTKGTEGVQLGLLRVPLFAAYPVTSPPAVWEQHPGMKPLIIPAGTSNGIALKISTGVASSTIDVVVELVETSFL